MLKINFEAIDNCDIAGFKINFEASQTFGLTDFDINLTESQVANQSYFLTWMVMGK